MMKNLKSIMFIFACLPRLAFAVDGLVAHYKFDNNTDDSQGNWASLVSDSTISYAMDRHGNEDSAISLDGDSILYAVRSDHIRSNFTFACWFKAESATELITVADDGIDGTSSDIRYLLGESLYPISIGSNGVNVFEQSDAFLPATIRYEKNFGDGWHHVAMSVENSGGPTLFLDGTAVASCGRHRTEYTPYIGNGVFEGGNCLTGLGAFCYGGRFKGRIDDVCFYDRALSEDEVRALRDGYSWQCEISDNEASVTGLVIIDSEQEKPASIMLPTELGGCSVTSVGQGSFGNLSNVVSLTIPASVRAIGMYAFNACDNLRDVWFSGSKVEKIGKHAFDACHWDLIMHVPDDWQGRGNTIAGYTVWRGSSSCSEKFVNLSVTNVIVQYVFNSIQPDIVVPTAESGLVNIITEVKSSGVVSVPTEWKNNYPGFDAKYGSDFSKALMKKSGKKDGAGNDMLVWQDFVAGTDPTKEDDVFTASISMVGAVPVICYTPELKDAEKDLRKYTTFGKKKITDPDWVEIAAGHEADYNFFKVTVEMK